MKEEPEIHLPSPSYWPILLAFGLVVISGGIIWGYYISIVGIVILLVSIAGWTLENRAAEREHPHE